MKKRSKQISQFSVGFPVGHSWTKVIKTNESVVLQRTLKNNNININSQNLFKFQVVIVH